MTETISPSLREDFVALIAKQTGIEISAQNYGSMGDNIFTRMKALKLVSPPQLLFPPPGAPPPCI